MNLYFDGGCKPNPGTMEICVYSDDKSVIYHNVLHYGTNNEAEWLALVMALMICEENGISPTCIYGDSQLIIKQATGVWKIKMKSLQIYKDEYDAITARIGNIKLDYVPRLKNLAGIYIESLY